MKRTFIIFIVVTLLFAVLPSFGDYTSRASWEEQIHGQSDVVLSGLHLKSLPKKQNRDSEKRIG